MALHGTQILAVAVSVYVALIASPLAAQTVFKAGSGDLNEKKVIAISQAAIGHLVGDYTFRDTQGRQVRLADFQGKPLIISMIYSSCAEVCLVMIKTLEKVDAVAREALGENAYNIVTIGFDVGTDTPVQMQSFARQNGVSVGQHWRFLSGDATAVAGLSHDIGFLYYASVKGFFPLTQTTILDADSRVYVHIYGETFATPALVDPLKNLVFGTTTPFASLHDLINKVRLFYTLYDPVSDRYHFEYAFLFRMVVGAVIILSMMAFIGEWLWQDHRRRLMVEQEQKTRQNSS